MTTDRIGRLWALSLLLLACGLGSVQAATYYVATDGVDAPARGSISEPYRTIRYGILQGSNGKPLQPGDTLYIRAGAYEEVIDLGDPTNAPAGTADAWITVAGYPGDARPVIRPPVGARYHVMAVSWTSTAFDSYLTLKDFEIDAARLTEGTALVIYTNYVTMENLYIHDPGRDCILGSDSWGKGGANHLTVRNCHIERAGRIQPIIDFNAKGVGVYFGGDDCLVENNLIENCRSDGIIFHNMYDPPNDNIARGNVIRNFAMDSPWPIPKEHHPDYHQWAAGITLGHGHGNRVYNNIICNAHSDDPKHFPASALYYWGHTNHNEAYNNTIYNVDLGAQLGILDTDHEDYNTIRNSIFAAVGRDFLINSNGTHNVMDHNLINPDVKTTFVDAAKADFHLKAGSPAIDKGAKIREVIVDFDRAARPQGKAYDIGAYERQ